MAKSFKQFLEEGKSISQKKAQFAKLLKRQEKYSPKSSEKPMKVADNDQPTSSRLGGGKRITPSNWLKPADKPNPWNKPKTPKPNKEKSVTPKPEKPKPVAKTPKTVVKSTKPKEGLAQKIDREKEKFKQGFRDRMSGPKKVASTVGSVVKPVAKVGGSILKGALKKQHITAYKPGNV